MTTKSSRQKERAASRKKRTIDDIAFNTGGPTGVTLEQIYGWVIWQFPRLRSITLSANDAFSRPDGATVRSAASGSDVFTGHSGAVHPNDIGHGWYPALIDNTAGIVLIFADVPEPFASPEAASKHFDQLPE